MSTNDYLKFLVQEMVKYMDTPREERREARMLRREQRMHWTYRLFGMVPFWYENVCRPTEEPFEGRIAVKQEHKTYQLVNLEDRSDVIERITQAEKDLNRLVHGRVALIAYVKDEKE